MQGFIDSPYAASDYYTKLDLMRKLDPIGLAKFARGAMANP